ncbi:3-oxoacyl-[acyl-carrier-protein] synthase III C-terminal domain-containing protein [Streptomyces mirabilis]|uniref:3-oxoacyl-[acyl-carrier-protein] synthase III C-terminal domain-containing protein n=1 Tax=Streptomyces mirabilis TaxID=68239 RepID=UPI0033AAD67F
MAPAAPVPTANSRTPTRRRGDRLGIGAPHRFGNIAEVGNTAAASIPLALADTAARDLARPGERSLLTAFGGGLTWGSLALSWLRRRYPVRTDRSRDTRMPLESIGRIG